VGPENDMFLVIGDNVIEDTDKRKGERKREVGSPYSTVPHALHVPGLRLKIV